MPFSLGAVWLGWYSIEENMAYDENFSWAMSVTVTAVSVTVTAVTGICLSQ